MQRRSLVLACNNKDFCSLFKDFVSMNYDIEIVGIANDGILALELVEQKQPHVLILDYILPHLDGLGVLERLRNIRTFQRPKIITITASLTEYFMITAYKLGANYQISRKIDIEEIINCVRMDY